MKKYIYLLLASLALLNFVACENLKNKTEFGGKKIIFVENKSIPDKLNLSQNRRYVQLDTKEECLIMEISQLLFTSKEIFIFDVYSQSVFVFDYAGRYLRKLHKVGQGPGEYSMMSAISLDEKRHRISVVDLGIRIINYDMDSFEYLGDYSINAVAAEEVAEGEYIAYNSLPIIKDGFDYDFHLLKYNDKGDVEKNMYLLILKVVIQCDLFIAFTNKKMICFFIPLLLQKYIKLQKIHVSFVMM